jgi:peptidyl-dipeptidase A
MTKNTPAIWLFVIMLLLGASSLFASPVDEVRLQDFITRHVQEIEPKSKDLALVKWNANASGEKKYYEQATALELEIKRIYADSAEFAFLKRLQEENLVSDPLLRRQLTILFNTYLKNQIDPALQQAIIEEQTAISQRFNTFRGKIGKRELSDTEILDILKTSGDSSERRQAWEASKQVGVAVASKLIELVRLRNQAARKLGFNNFYEMALITNEQDPAQIERIFDELKVQTDRPYRKLKGKLDAVIASRMGVKPEDLRPWHYANPFFQEVSEMGEVNVDALFTGKDLAAIAKGYFTSMGLPVDDILDDSDLYPRKGKYQHAFCTDIDRQGDVRTMCNLVADHTSMNTLLHELGHGIYSKNIDRKLPWLLRSSSHALTTEAIALLMGRQAYNADWLASVLGKGMEEIGPFQTALDDNLRLSQLLFSRWTQVMMRFERSLYSNPDQDLNKVWWDLVEEYQFVKRPENRHEPDWAAKIHLASTPCYYHNYMLGEMVASQILNAIIRNVMKKDQLREISFVGQSQVGAYLREKVFQPGASLEWNELLKHATGESLTSKYFTLEFIGK